jgi:hypothetical protein
MWPPETREERALVYLLGKGERWRKDGCCRKQREGGGERERGEGRGDREKGEGRGERG